MLKTIVQREILEYLKSSKFLIGLCLTVVLVGISTFINIGDYLQRQQDYIDAKRSLKSEDDSSVKIFRKPQILSIFVQGKDRELGSRIEISELDFPIQSSGYMGEHTSQHHRYVSGFASVDFAFVVRVVLSLMVIFLAYNSISEERVQGTLRLTLANPLSRGQLLFGKLLGGIFVILGSLTIATLIAVLVIVLHPAISLDGDLFLRILGMWGISALYLGAFFTLGLMASTIFNRPSVALLVLLQIWIIIVIYPNVSVILSQHLLTLPSSEKLSDRQRALFEPYEQEYNKTTRAFHNMVTSGQMDEEISKKNFELSAQRTELFHQADNEYSQQLTRQMHLAQNIAIFSPSVLYNSIMQRIACTDIREYDKFMEGVERYWHKAVEKSRLLYTDFEAYKEFKFPEFTYTIQSVTESIVCMLLQWIILFLLSVVFFVGAHAVFMRKNIG